MDADPVETDRPAPADVGVFLLSGGTTGLPKLIPRTHRDYVYNLEASAKVCGFGPGTVYLVVLPAAHNFALACPGILGVLATGGTVVLAPSGSPDEAFPLIERERATVCAVVPPIALLWLDAVSWAEEDVSSLELLQVGGAKFAAERAAEVPETLGCRVQQVFGMAEGLLNYTRLDDPRDIVEQSQGRPLSPADEIRIVDENGADVAPGEIGELLTRGPYTLRGYYRAPSTTRARSPPAASTAPATSCGGCRPATWSSRDARRTRSTAAATRSPRRNWRTTCSPTRPCTTPPSSASPTR
nr:AMP-binding protein [Actinomadura sp. CNU-125]